MSIITNIIFIGLVATLYVWLFYKLLCLMKLKKGKHWYSLIGALYDVREILRGKYKYEIHR